MLPIKQHRGWKPTFRYAVFNPRGLSYSQDAFGDRSYEVKARLLRERNILPEVALGVRDLLGTGVWEGEYFVASKKVNDFDLTAGLGWEGSVRGGSSRTR